MFWKNHSLRRRTRQLVTILLQTGALACIFPMPHPLSLWWAAHALQVALGYLAAGMVALIFNWPRLMFVCLGCSAVISFYYHEKNTAPLPPVQLEQAVPAQDSAHVIQKTH